MNLRALHVDYKNIFLISRTIDYRCQVPSTPDQVLIPLPNSTVGALSLKTLDVAYKLDPSQISCSKALGEVMSFKPVTIDGLDFVFVAYESGEVALWDIKAKNVIGWLTVEECPLTVDFDVNIMRGIVGGVTDKLQVIE